MGAHMITNNMSEKYSNTVTLSNVNLKHENIMMTRSYSPNFTPKFIFPLDLHKNIKVM